MAKRTVKIEIPISTPDKFNKLLAKIIKRHTDLGKDSPLLKFEKIDMKEFTDDDKEANAFRSKSEALKEESEKEMENANNIYGTGEGQTEETPGTLYHQVGLILSHFRGSVYKGNEEAISEWGFNVVIGTAKSPKPRQKKG